jgi:hypothetical protein
MKRIHLILTALVYGLMINAQPKIKFNTVFYKTVDTIKLRMLIYVPVSEEKNSLPLSFFMEEEDSNRKIVHSLNIRQFI